MFAIVYTVAVHTVAMRPFIKLSSFRLIVCCLVFGAVLFATVSARADVRGEAILAVSKLHDIGAKRYLPDDMNSLDSALAEAELCEKRGDRNNAEKLYLLALQKAQVILTLLEIPQTTHDPTAEPDGKKIDSETALDPPPLTASEPESDNLSSEVASSKLIGGSGVYKVVKGDSIRLISAKLGVTRQHLLKLNNLDTNTALKAGQKLIYNNRKIIPKHLTEGILVNIPDRTLYFFQQGTLVNSLPVALGVSTKNEKYVWQTPVGKFRVTAKQKDPTWFVPASIRAEMEEQGKEVVTKVPPGPKNPLGKFAIKTSLPGILIHSTTMPWSVYGYASHGCIRVYPERMEELFNEVKINTLGEIIYNPVKLAVTDSGKIFLEVHNDIYNKGTNVAEEARRMIDQQNLTDRVDWKKVEALTKQKTGVAEDITM